MSKQQLTRWIPAGYSLIAKDERFGFEVYARMEPKIVALAYAGKRTKPDWHFQFASEDRLRQKIEDTLRGLMAWQERKAEWKAKRNAPHDVKVGDVFRCSWGYDQTNIDYFECTSVIGAHTIEVRPIAQDSIETLSMQGECVPMRGAYTGEAVRKRVKMVGGEPAIAIYSYANAYRLKPVATVAGVPMYGASHWTAYA